MKYYLVNKLDEINTKVDLIVDIGLEWSNETYFIGIKQIDGKEFDKLWKVMTEEQYDLQFKGKTLQDRQLGKRKYEWWKDEPSDSDDGFDY